MKPSDIITESIEHRELEEAPMGFWKNLGYKVAGSVLNPFDSRSLYQGKQEIGKRADALAREFRKYLATIPGNQATGDTLVKWLQRKKLNTAGVSKMISQSAQQSQATPSKKQTVQHQIPATEPTNAKKTQQAATISQGAQQSQAAQSEKQTVQQQIAATQQANTQKAQQDAAIKAAKDAAIAKPGFQRTAADNLAIRKAQQKGIREAVKESKQSKKSASKQLSLVLAEGTDAEEKVSTFLSPEQIDSFILRAVQDTANQEHNDNLDAQGTQSASSESTSQQSSATSTQQPSSSEPTSQQPASSEPTSQQPASSEPTSQQPASSEPTPQPSPATSAQPKDELNDIRRLSGIVRNHEDRIKKLEAGKTDNRVKFTGKKTGT